MNKALTWQQLPVLIALVVAIAGGSVVWGQTTERVHQLESRQDAIDDTIGAVRKQQETDSRLLSVIEERTKTMQAMQERLFNELTRMPRAGFLPQ